ncbi:MAG: SoxR reducing system RseC family protein [Candidatus Aminicenantes bacterium]|nr:SoxR reducing system RseC family protein [Candidatus Aminicenantes bacterium]
MKDNATVIRVQDGLAWVKVTPKVACCECSARALCSAKQDEEGKLAVRNPVDARPGDEVEIDVPETDYSRALSAIFGFLLIASLAGLAFGYIFAPVRSLAPGINGLIGLMAGLGLGGLAVRHRYRSGKHNAGWPVIIAVLKKGGFHG